MSFHQYSWNSEVETTWISLIGWQHKTSINGTLLNFGKRYKDDLRVIFEQWSKLHIGLDALNNQKILIGVYLRCTAMSFMDLANKWFFKIHGFMLWNSQQQDLLMILQLLYKSIFLHRIFTTQFFFCPKIVYLKPIFSIKCLIFNTNAPYYWKSN